MNVSIAKPVFPKKTNLEKYNKKVIIDSNKKLIGIAPFAKHEAKTYSFEKMKRVIEYVSEEHIILLFGGGEIEGKLLGEISENNKNVFSLVNGFTLSDQMDFMSNLNLMISMDSANGHLAAMYGVKVITIWGVTHPYAGFLPFNQNIENSIMPDRKKYPKIPTSIYGDKYPYPPLYNKSQFLNKNTNAHSKQIAFETRLSKLLSNIDKSEWPDWDLLQKVFAYYKVELKGERFYKL